MTVILLFLLILICSLDLVRATVKPSLFCELPTLLSVVYIGFVIPQCIALLPDLGLLNGGLAKVLIISISILLCTKLGWRLAMSTKYEIDVRHYNAQDISYLVVAVSIIGAVFYISLARLPTELTGVSQWTGAPTILYFFTKIQTLAFALSLIHYFKYRQRAMLYLAFFNGAFLLSTALGDARREPTIEFILIVLLSGWFARRYLPSRLVLISGSVGLIVFVSSIAEVRNVLFDTDENDLKRRTSVSIEDFASLTLLKAEVAPIDSELGNAARIVDALDASGEFSWGRRIWDTIVFSYVPGQWVGFENKEWLQIYRRNIPDTAGVTTNLGTTITAFADTFEGFSYLGSVLFGFVGYFYGRLYRLAFAGSFFHQYFYAIAITPALLSITHGIIVFPARLPALMIFSALIFVFLPRTRTSYQ